MTSIDALGRSGVRAFEKRAVSFARNRGRPYPLGWFARFLRGTQDRLFASKTTLRMTKSALRCGLKTRRPNLWVMKRVLLRFRKGASSQKDTNPTINLFPL